MSRSKQRTSFALDHETLRYLQQLAEQWHTSQAEVVRRAVRLAVEQDRIDTEGIAARLKEYQSAARLTSEQADRYTSELAAERADWQRGDNS